MRSREVPVCQAAAWTDRPVSITGVLYKLQGSSQPSLVACSDGALYVVKFLEFSGRYGLMNEVLGYELLRRLGLPCPEWRPLSVSDEFIGQHPMLWFRSGEKVIRPRGGIHFGSRLLVADSDHPSYQIIPRRWWSRVENRTDFVTALIFDMWANNCDRRQAVFLKPRSSDALQAFFIDNDHLFGGRWGDETSCPRMVMLRDLAAYQGIWSPEAANASKDAIAKIDDARLTSLVSTVPAQWASRTEIVDRLERLSTRRRRLDAWIREAESVLEHAGASTRLDQAVCATKPDLYRSV